MPDCLFCKVANKEVPAAVVYEDAHVSAFLDVHPKAPGHLLVIPKVHAAHIRELPDAELGPLFAAVKTMSKRLEERLGAEGFTIGINDGEVGGQAVAHLHVHILPRFAGDKGGSVHTVVENPPRESVQEIAAKLR